MFRNILLLTLLLGAVNHVQGRFSFGSCPDPSLQSSFTPSSYVGRWYEAYRDKDTIFEIFQKCSTATYTATNDGGIAVLN